MNFYQNHENWNFIKSNKMGRGVGVVAVGKWIGGKNLAIKPSKMEKNFHENSPQALRLIKDNFILHKSIIFDIHEWWRIILFFTTTKSYQPDWRFISTYQEDEAKENWVETHQQILNFLGNSRFSKRGLSLFY